MSRIIFEDANVDRNQIPEALGGVFLKILYVPAIIVAVYSVVFVIQVVIEKLALSSGTDSQEDVNRSLSTQERQFIQKNLERVERYIAQADYPPFFSWFFWPSLFLMIVSFIAFPSAVVWIESEFVDAVAMSGIAQDDVISSLGPAYIGGVLFSFLFGAALYWAALQWLGMHYRKFGEYLHSRWGWNSMSSEARSLNSYAKIFTRFVRLRKYYPEQDVAPSDFLFDAFNEFGGLVFKLVIALGAASILFTALDVNWRRITHIGGMNYSPYFDLRSLNLHLDDIIYVEVRCFLYEEGDDGAQDPGVGYDVVFANGMRGYLFDGDIDDALLTKVEAVDAIMRARDVSIVPAARAGRVFLRGLTGYRSDCADAVLQKFEPDLRSRIAHLIRNDSDEFPLKN